MRLSVSTLTCPVWDAAKACSFLRSVGIQHVDLRSIAGRTDLWDIEELASDAVFRENGVTVDGISTSVRIGSDGVTGSTADGEQEFEQCLELCARLGGTYLRVFAGDKDAADGPAPAEVFERIGRTYRKLCGRADASGIDVLVETHDVVSSSADVLSLIAAADHRRAGIVWDVRHPLRHARESFEYTAEKLRDVVRLVHVKDFAGPPDYELVEFGTGIIDAEKLVSILTSVGYDGSIVLEQPRVASTGKPAPEPNITQFAAAFRPHVPR